MCTVTFIARQKGYALGMNRDEKLSRPAAHPPARIEVGGRAVVCPSETAGGTWIAVNDTGTSFALINWYAISARVRRGAVSRGDVVKAVCAAASPGLADEALSALPLRQINPFRLIGFFPAKMRIVEWRWNLKKLIKRAFQWKTRQWVSSGFDELRAQRVRGETFRQALLQSSSGSMGWLRRLHSSHTPQIGPFSTCMHRADAATVSYTEISVSSRSTSVRYLGGPACHASGQRSEHQKIKL